MPWVERWCASLIPGLCHAMACVALSLNACHLSKTMKSSRRIYLSSDNPMESLIEASVRCLLAANPVSHSLTCSYFIKGNFPVCLWLLFHKPAATGTPQTIIAFSQEHQAGTSHMPGPAWIREEDLGQFLLAMVSVSPTTCGQATFAQAV